jgi:proteic killer suppression protein
MIVSFSCKETEKIWQGVSSRKLPVDIQERALRKLRQLEASANLDDLRIPPGNRLEALSGDRIGEIQYPYYKAMADLFYLGKWKCL